MRYVSFCHIGCYAADLAPVDRKNYNSEGGKARLSGIPHTSSILALACQSIHLKLRKPLIHLSRGFDSHLQANISLGSSHLGALRKSLIENGTLT